MEENYLEINFITSKQPFDLIKKYIKHKLKLKYIFYEKIEDHKNNKLTLCFFNYKGKQILVNKEILSDIKNEIKTFKNEDMFLCYKNCFLLEQLRYKNYDILSHPKLEEFYYIKKNNEVINYINKFKNLNICRTFLENKIVKKILSLKILGLSEKPFIDLFKSNLESVTNIHYICNNYDSINLKRIEKGLCPIFEYYDKFKFILCLEKLNKKYNLPIFTNSFIKNILENELIELPFFYIYKEVVNIIDNNLITHTIKFNDENDAYTYYLKLYYQDIKCILYNTTVYYTYEEKISFDSSFKDTKLLNYLELNSKNKIKKLSNKEIVDSFIDDDVLILGKQTFINSETKNPIKLHNYNPLISNGFEFTFNRKNFKIKDCINIINLNTNSYIIKNKQDNTELIQFNYDHDFKILKKAIYKLEKYGYFLNTLGLSYYIDSGIILNNTVVLPEFFNKTDIEGIIYLSNNI